jgi:hypothetical protein
VQKLDAIAIIDAEARETSTARRGDDQSFRQVAVKDEE